MLMNTAQVLVKCLESEGVKYIFGIPGEENLEIIEALRDSPIQFITVRHEQGAAFMADMYGRLTGRMVRRSSASRGRSARSACTSRRTSISTS